MSPKKIHRISVYLLDPDRRRILLFKEKAGIHKGKFVPPACAMDETRIPTETIRKMIRQVVPVDVEFISSHTSVPKVMDGRTVRFGAPLFVQLTHVDDTQDHVDFVFLAQAATAPDLEDQADAGWFNTEDLIGSMAPKHVKTTVRSILSLFHV